MGKSKPLPRHILVLRLSAMGDVAMLPHAVGALKSACPNVRVTIVSKPQFRPFFEGLDVDFLPVDTRGRHHGLKGLLTLAKEMHRTGADAFADEHGVLRSAVLRVLLRLRGLKVVRIDKGKREKRWALATGNAEGPWLKHTVTRYCDTLRKLGFDFPDPPKAAKISRPNPLPQFAAATMVGFAPFSAHRGKSCPDNIRRRITELLSSRFDRLFIHSGGGAEADFALEMEQKYPNVTAIHGKVKGLGEEMDLISNLDCMVSMDSLTMHLAALTATPVVSIWGATHPKLGFLGYGCGTEGIVQTDMECRPCSTYGGRECRFGTYACMESISPEEVAARVEAIIKKSKTL